MQELKEILIMKRNCGIKDALTMIIYGVYDKEDNLLFTGNIDEITKFMGCTKSNVYSADHLGHKVKRTYYVNKVGLEPVTEKRCYKCGEVKPIKQMHWRHRKSDGKLIPTTICKKCKREEDHMRDYKNNDRFEYVYFVHDGEKLVCTGNCKEVAAFGGITTSSVYRCVNEGRKMWGRYTVTRKKHKKGE